MPEYRVEIVKEATATGIRTRYRVHTVGGLEVVPWTFLASGHVWHRPDGMDVTVPLPVRDAHASTLNEKVWPDGRTDHGSQPADPREPWQVVAEDDMGLKVARPNANHVQFLDAETGKVEADWWPSTGRLKIYGYAANASQRKFEVGTWTDVLTGERAVYLLRQA